MVAGFKALRRISHVVVMVAALIIAAIGYVAPAAAGRGEPGLTTAPYGTVSFSPATVTAGQSSTMTMTITNPTNETVDGTFEMNYSGGEFNIDTAHLVATGDCYLVSGRGRVRAVIGDPLPANSSCSISVPITALVGSYTGTPILYYNIVGSTSSAPVTFTVTPPPPSATVSLSPSTIIPGQPATLTITVDNPTDAPISYVTLGGGYNGNLQFGTVTKSGTSNCDFNGGGANFTLISLGISARSSCTISVPVTASGPGTYTLTPNRFEYGSVSYTPPAPVSLRVTMAPPAATVQFSPATIVAGQSSTLTITLSNPNSVGNLNNVVFTSTFPSTLKLGTPTSNCTVPRNSTSVTLVASVISANSACTVSIPVTTTGPGTFTLTPTPPAAQGSGQDGVGTAPAPITLTVTPPPPTVALAAGRTQFRVGEDTTVTVTLTNPNGTTLHGVTDRIAVPRGSPLQFGSARDSTCTGATFAQSGANHYVSGVELAPNASCQFSFTVTGLDVTENFELSTGIPDSDESDAGVVGQSLYFTIGSALTATVTEVIATPNPGIAGQSAELGVTVKAEGQPVQGGTVSITIGGQPIPACTDLPLAGGATCNLPGQRAGEYHLTASFTPAQGSGFEASSGDATFYVNVADPGDQSFVSGEGDDANECSRTGPCQTFQRALEMTSDGGTISCLTPGGFGPVTIDKSVSIQCNGMGGRVMASGENAITIIAPADASVVLDGLDLDGLGRSEFPGGQNGIAFVSGRALTVRNSQIRGFRADYGISFTPGGNAQLTLDNVTVTDNGNATPDSGGVLVRPRAGTVRVTIHDSRMTGNTTGIRLDATTVAGATVSASITGTTLSGSGSVGLYTRGSATGTVRAWFDRGSITGNGIGVLTSGATSRTVISRTGIQGNATGLSVSNAGENHSIGDNLLGTAQGSFTATVAPR